MMRFIGENTRDERHVTFACKKQRGTFPEKCKRVLNGSAVDTCDRRTLF